MNLKQAVNRYKTASFIYLKNTAPMRKGELKRSMKLINRPNGWEIRITAPHTVYTEEKWKHPRWRWENPNLYWIRKGVKQSLRRFANQTGGKLYVIEPN